MPLPSDLPSLIVRKYCQMRDQLRESLWTSAAAEHVPATGMFVTILRAMPPVAQVAEFTLRSKVSGKQRR